MKLYGPQSLAAPEFTSMAACIEQMEQRVQRISGLGQAATGFFYLYVGTYNVRTLSGDDKLWDLEMELSKIKWTIIGLSKVQLKSKDCIIHNNTGHTMYYSGGNECQYV